MAFIKNWRFVLRQWIKFCHLCCYSHKCFGCCNWSGNLEVYSKFDSDFWRILWCKYQCGNCVNFGSYQNQHSKGIKMNKITVSGSLLWNGIFVDLCQACYYVWDSFLLLMCIISCFQTEIDEKSSFGQPNSEIWLYFQLNMNIQKMWILMRFLINFQKLRLDSSDREFFPFYLWRISWALSLDFMFCIK